MLIEPEELFVKDFPDFGKRNKMKVAIGGKSEVDPDLQNPPEAGIIVSLSFSMGENRKISQILSFETVLLKNVLWNMSFC